MENCITVSAELNEAADDIHSGFWDNLRKFRVLYLVHMWSRGRITGRGTSVGNMS